MWLSNCLEVLLLFSYVFLEGGVNSIDAYFITNIWSIFVTISCGLEGSLFSKFHMLDC